MRPQLLLSRSVGADLGMVAGFADVFGGERAVLVVVAIEVGPVFLATGIGAVTAVVTAGNCLSDDRTGLIGFGIDWIGTVRELYRIDCLSSILEECVSKRTDILECLVILLGDALGEVLRQRVWGSRLLGH